MKLPALGLLVALPLLAGCMSPLEVEEHGWIQVLNSSEAAVDDWQYRYCGESELHVVQIESPQRVIAPGERASKLEVAGSCTDHVFRLTTGRVINRNGITTIVDEVTEIELLPEE